MKKTLIFITIILSIIFLVSCTKTKTVPDDNVNDDTSVESVDFVSTKKDFYESKNRIIQLNDKPVQIFLSDKLYILYSTKLQTFDKESFVLLEETQFEFEKFIIVDFTVYDNKIFALCVDYSKEYNEYYITTLDFNGGINEKYKLDIQGLPTNIEIIDNTVYFKIEEQNFDDVLLKNNKIAKYDLLSNKLDILEIMCNVFTIANDSTIVTLTTDESGKQSIVLYDDSFNIKKTLLLETKALTHLTVENDRIYLMGNRMFCSTDLNLQSPFVTHYSNYVKNEFYSLLSAFGEKSALLVSNTDGKENYRIEFCDNTFAESEDEIIITVLSNFLTQEEFNYIYSDGILK